MNTLKFKYGITPTHLLEHVICPTLQEMDDKNIKSSSRLLLGIAAVESMCGKYLKQINGPAKGLFQMEPDTEQDLFNNYLSHKPRLESKVNKFKSANSNFDATANLAYQVAVARANLYRIPEELPDAYDIEAMGGYWKKYWNTALGKGKVRDFVSKYPLV